MYILDILISIFLVGAGIGAFFMMWEPHVRGTQPHEDIDRDENEDGADPFDDTLESDDPVPTGIIDEERLLVAAINQWSELVWRVASERGWWPVDKCAAISNKDPIHVAAMLALIHSEVSEALECVRDDEWIISYEEDGKPVGLPIELGDIVVRVMDLVFGLDINLGSAMMVKTKYNTTRSHRHGGKNL